jgi:hypothetical protein
MDHGHGGSSKLKQCNSPRRFEDIPHY